MELAFFGFAYLLLLISIFNYFSIRTPADPAGVAESVTVLLPVRNEEGNIARCLEGLKSQTGIDKFQVIIINDQSTDATAEIAQSAIAGDSRFSIINTEGPRSGWLGKVSALQTGFEAAKSDVIVTIDADVHLEPPALASSVNLINEIKLDFISPYPLQIAVSIAEKLIQPLLHWSWMTTVILRLAEKKPHPSTAVANGQLFVVRKNALDHIGGFSSVRDKILDDIELARALLRAGYRGTVAEGSSIAQTRMYQNFSEIKAGYGKSLHKAFGGILGAAIAILFFFITGVLPVIFILIGSPLGWLVYSSIVFTRTLSDTKSKSDSFFALFHPISSLLLIYLIGYSWAKRGSIQWKGRTV